MRLQSASDGPAVWQHLGPGNTCPDQDIGFLVQDIYVLVKTYMSCPRHVRLAHGKSKKAQPRNPQFLFNCGVEVPGGPRAAAQAKALSLQVKSCCDVLMNLEDSEWAGVWGRPRSSDLLALGLVVAPVPVPVSARGPDPVGVAAGRVSSKRSWEEVSKKNKYRKSPPKNIRTEGRYF